MADEKALLKQTKSVLGSGGTDKESLVFVFFFFYKQIRLQYQKKALSVT